MFDTHCHLNFARFKNIIPETITRAKEHGVEMILIPGTDVATSQKAVEIAENNEGIYAAVGIHPHHVYELYERHSGYALSLSKGLPRVPSDSGVVPPQNDDLRQIEKLLSYPKVVAVGEMGMDRHMYENTKYRKYEINETFVNLQKELLTKQLQLAVLHKKSVILHNREAKEDVLRIVSENWDSSLDGRAVFHCCEPDGELLQFAKDHKMFIGVDGDITYYPEKQEFIKSVPPEMLILETDAPFLLPEPLRTEKKYPNEPKNLKMICEFIARLLGMSSEELGKITTENGRRLFSLHS